MSPAVAVRWPERTVLDRFMEKVEVDEDGCWIWKAYLDPAGYGRFTISNEASAQLAHRVSYGLHVGPIADGLTLDHLCRNRACVNPEHLEPVTLDENKRRGESPSMINATKTHCRYGHPFDETNTRRRGGGRACRACGRLRRQIEKAAAISAEPIRHCQAPGCSNEIPRGSRPDRLTCSSACRQRRGHRITMEAKSCAL